MAFLVQFSPELRSRIKSYFAERYGVVLSDDQADEYLDTLAKLVDWIKKRDS